MSNLLPEPATQQTSLSADLLEDVSQIKANIEVTDMVRIILLSAFHSCENLSKLSTRATSNRTTTSYHRGVVKELPYHALQMLNGLRIIHLNTQLSLYDAEVKENYFLTFVQRILCDLNGKLESLSWPVISTF